MLPSAKLLSAFESCARAGVWSLHWVKHRLTPTQMLTMAVNAALTEDHEDPGENASEHLVALAAERGLEVSDNVNVYRCAMNHAAIADIVTTAIKSRWQPIEPVNGWESSCYQCNGHLRRFLPVSHWSEERELFERRSWYVLGEVAHYHMPMQLVVCVMGQMSGGRRTGPFSKALLHPQRSHLRFRKKSRGTIEGFKETWNPVYREEHSEIGRDRWLESMIQDEVLQDHLFVVEIPVPSEAECAKVRALSSKTLDRIAQIQHLPDQQLSTCFDPISPCPFRSCCHAETETVPSEKIGFDCVQSPHVIA